MIFPIFVILLVSFVINEKCEGSGVAIEARQNQFPFYAEIGYKNNNTWTSECGGTLIDTKWILAVAYYFSKKNSTGKVQVNVNKRDDLVATMGSDSKGCPEVKFSRIAKVHIHPNYTINYTKEIGYGIIQENNVALVELDDAFQLSDCIDLIQLPKLQESSTRCKEGIILGTGSVNERKLYAKITSKFNHELEYFKVSFSSFFYAEVVRNETNVMWEETGTPFLCHDKPDDIIVQYGMLSVRIYGKKNGVNIILGIYEEMDKHLNFIKEIVPNVRIYQDNPEWNLAKPKIQELRKSNSNDLQINYFVMFIIAYL